MSESAREDAGSVDQAITTGDIVGWRWAPAPPGAAASGRPAAGSPTAESPTAAEHPATPAGSAATDATDARYRPLLLLGQGGMGEVMLCRDGVIRREVAMKRILPSHEGDAEARTRFIYEAQIQGQLEHPAIVPVYDLGVAADGPVFFTMKRLRGRTLEDILAGLKAGNAADLAAFPRYRLLQTLASVCLAIDFAHARGVIHRDLKPGNIMLGDFGEVYVIDWGLAKLQAGPGAGQVAGQVSTAQTDASGQPQPLASALGSVTGTLAYMSPEQASGVPERVDKRSDVFTLGVILFELLTLERLRPSGTVQGMLVQIYEEQGERPSARAPRRDIPPELDEICLRATHKDPAARYDSARALHDALSRHLAGERDVALRKELAATYTRSASAAAERALTGDPDAVAARRAALADVGRALALDPGDAPAWHVLHRLLTEPPRKLPPEVEAEVQACLAEREHLSLGSLLLTGCAFFFLVPTLLLMGVRSGPLMAVLVLTGLASLALRWRVSRLGVASPWRYVAQLASLSLYFCIGRILGPLILMPVPLMIHATLNALSGNRGHRIFSVVSSCALLLGMVLLEQLGVLAPSYAASGDGFLVLPGLAHLPLAHTQVLLTGMCLLTVVLCSLSLSRLPQRLLDAERQQALHAWQMRLLVDERRGRGPTDTAG